jgi:beta-ribofuranosylaminobenzene 5'-phosphate synthase
VILRTPSRIHLTLIDLNAGLGRVDGGIGLALEEPAIEITAKKSDEILIKGHFIDKAYEAAVKMMRALNIKEGVEIDVRKAYHAHAGLGSGTQIMLGIGAVISKLHDIDMPVRKIADIMGRGGTSGIGVASFEKGGFVLDGGHSTKEKVDFLPSSTSNAKPAPILARYDFPNWKIALVTPKGRAVHGEKEVNIFRNKCPIPLSEVRKLSHIILMKTLPAIVEEEISAFGESIDLIQETGFKKVEIELQNKIITGLLDRCQKNSFGAGLSSFGPTIYCIVDDDEKLIDAVGKDARVIFTKANNIGARII